MSMSKYYFSIKSGKSYESGYCVGESPEAAKLAAVAGAKRLASLFPSSFNVNEKMKVFLQREDTQEFFEFDV